MVRCPARGIPWLWTHRVPLATSSGRSPKSTSSPSSGWRGDPLLRSQGSRPLDQLARTAARRPTEVDRPKPSSPRDGSQGLLPQPGLLGHGSRLSGVAGPMARGLWMPSPSGRKLHRSGIPRRHHRRLLPQPGGFPRRQRSPPTSLVSGAGQQGGHRGRAALPAQTGPCHRGKRPGASAADQGQPAPPGKAGRPRLPDRGHGDGFPVRPERGGGGAQPAGRSNARSRPPRRRAVASRASFPGN